MNAIVYAAGRAGRLGTTLRKPHKILLEFGGRTLLERHVEHLATLQVPRLFVVTGHERKAVAAEFPALQRKHGVEILELFNPDYTEGSVLSMRVSVPILMQATEPVLLMDGDVLYGVEMLRRLIGSAHRTVLLIDRNYSTADDDPVLVPMRDGKPFDFVKRWAGQADAIGESVGLFKVDPADLPALIAETESRATGSGRADSYDDALRVLARAGRFAAEDITGLPWVEIDFPGDMQHAENVTLPALQKTLPTTRNP